MPGTTRKSFSDIPLADTRVKAGSANYDAVRFPNRMPRDAKGHAAKLVAMRDITKALATGKKSGYGSNLVSREYVIMQALEADNFLPEDARRGLALSAPIKHDTTKRKQRIANAISCY